MNVLVVVGKQFKLNTLFLDYIIREAKGNIPNIDIINIFDSKENLNLKELVAISQNIFLVVELSDFKSIQSALEELNFKEPYISRENSYVYKLEDKLINLIIANSNLKLPEFLLNNQKVDTTINVFGIDEKSCEILLSGIANEFEAEIFAYKFVEGWSKVLVKAKNFGRISQFVDEANLIFPNKLIITDNIVKYLVEKFSQNGKVIAIAESCTGGMLSSLFTQESGVSEIFEGSVITYSNKIKNSWLSVKNENLENYGAVSEAVIKDMLKGAIKITGANYSIAISGIAGPNGGTQAKPVGTVFIGVRDNDNESELVSRVILEGDRVHIQKQSCYIAIMMLIEMSKDRLL